MRKREAELMKFGESITELIGLCMQEVGRIIIIIIISVASGTYQGGRPLHL